MCRLSAIKSGCCREVAEVTISGGLTEMMRTTRSLKCNKMKCKEDYPIKGTTYTLICKKKASLFVISSLIFPRCISDQFNDQLPVGLLVLSLDTVPVLHRSGFESEQAFFQALLS